MIKHTTSTMRGEVNAAVYIPSKPCSIRSLCEVRGTVAQLADALHGGEVSVRRASSTM